MSINKENVKDIKLIDKIIDGTQDIAYNNTTSGLTAVTLKDAIDEVKAMADVPAQVVTSLTLVGNTLTYLDENLNQTNINLGQYLDNTDKFVVSGHVQSGTLTLTLNDSSTVNIDVSSLIDDTNTYVVQGNVSGSTMTLTMNNGSAVNINVSSLLDNTDKFVVSGSVSQNTLTLTLNDGSTVPINISGIQNTSVNTNTLTFNTSYVQTGSEAVGTLSWNQTDETLDLVVGGGSIYQIGQEDGVVARNLSGTTLVNGSVVRVTGASGSKITIDLADNTTEAASSATFAVCTQTISNNSTGKITTSGLVRDLNTSAFTEGVAIWLGTNGQFTATKPVAPNHLVHIGWVVRSHATQGMILVKVSNGWEISELHDVLITNVANGQLLQWNNTTKVWENKDLASMTAFTSALALKANISSLATVATSGSYGDLSNKPTNVSSFTNDSGYLTSVDANTLTGTTLKSTVVNSSLTSVGTLSALRVSGSSNLGTNTFTKAAYGAGDILLDNGTTDTPGLLMYYANNKNWGIDSWSNGTGGLQQLRFVSDLNESGGAVRAFLDTTGKFTATSFAGNGSQLTSILQTVQAVKTDTWTGTASYNTYTAITGLSATITPKSTSSKILIMTTINYDNNRGNSGGGFVIFRNGSMLTGAAGVPGSNQYSVFADFGANANADQSGMSRSFQIIDSPNTTSALTYDIRITQDSTSYTTYVNRARADAAQNDDGRFASSIILLEIS